MTKKTLAFIHESYNNALQVSDNIIDVLQNLYNILLDAEVEDEDAKSFDSFIDGLRGCIRFREKTFFITNIVTYLYITIMYIILWLNSTKGLHIDINLYARRKSLESDLTKLLCKSSSNLSANIRDRFGLRGILLNEEDIALDYIYQMFDAISGILGGKDRKMSKDFIKWFEDNQNIPIIDKCTIRQVLQIPFGIEFIKDFIKNPKENGYRTLQFTMVIQMYSDILPGLPIELQFRTKEMHENAVFGSASHQLYKNELLEQIDSVFVVDDFSKLHIHGFTSYDSKEDDRDGIHFSKDFANRRISSTLVP